MSNNLQAWQTPSDIQALRFEDGLWSNQGHIQTSHQAHANILQKKISNTPVLFEVHLNISNFLTKVSLNGRSLIVFIIMGMRFKTIHRQWLSLRNDQQRYAVTMDCNLRIAPCRYQRVFLLIHGVFTVYEYQIGFQKCTLICNRL